MSSSLAPTQRRWRVWLSLFPEASAPNRRRSVRVEPHSRSCFRCLAMNANSVFNIGATHAVCQDYVIARSRAPHGGPYVVMSDGCSSSPDTDVGARLLVKAIDQMLVRTAPRDVCKLHKECARTALGWAELIGLPAQAVDATLLSAHV